MFRICIRDSCTTINLFCRNIFLWRYIRSTIVSRRNSWAISIRGWRNWWIIWIIIIIGIKIFRFIEIFYALRLLRYRICWRNKFTTVKICIRHIIRSNISYIVSPFIVSIRIACFWIHTYTGSRTSKSIFFIISFSSILPIMVLS